MRIICLTSNAYINCIEPFAHFWNRFGGDRYDVNIFGYEERPHAPLPANFGYNCIGNQQDHTWSSGLLVVLEAIQDELVLLVLEDYFMSAPVDWQRIDEIAWWMELAAGVGKVDLSGDRLKVAHEVIGADLIMSCPDAPYLMSVQAAIWRRRFLKAFLRSSENAWQAEKYGTKRVSKMLQARDGSFPGYVLGTRTPAMQYANAVGGEGHKPGVIEARHMPKWMFEECVEKGWAHG